MHFMGYHPLSAALKASDPASNSDTQLQRTSKIPCSARFRRGISGGWGSEALSAARLRSEHIVLKMPSGTQGLEWETPVGLKARGLELSHEHFRPCQRRQFRLRPYTIRTHQRSDRCLP